MKVLFLLPYPIEVASTRQRVIQFFPYLEKCGIRCFASSFISSDFFKILYKPGRVLQKMGYTLRGFLKRLDDLRSVSNYDVVFIQREAFPFGTTIMEKMVSAGKTVIYDFDDAIYRMNPARPSLVPFLRRPSKVATIIELSSCVIAGNQHLANYALRYNSHVEVVPTCIDTDYYTPEIIGKKSDKIVVGWIGSRTTISYILAIKDVLLDLTKRFNIVFKIVANEAIDLGFETTFKQWTLDEELEDLRGFDIGIMPLPNNEWTRAKCGYKIIQYMAVGKPVVASPVGVNREIIKDGVNGFLAEGQEQWRNKLIGLIESATLRAQFGKLGRKTAQEIYSLKVNAPKLLAILERYR